MTIRVTYILENVLKLCFVEKEVLSKQSAPVSPILMPLDDEQTFSERRPNQMQAGVPI